MALQITGTVMLIGDQETRQSRSGKEYTARELVIIKRRFDPYTGKPYQDPQDTPKFTFFGDRCKALEGVGIGDVVMIDFDLVGRSYLKEGQTAYFNDIRTLGVRVTERVSDVFSKVQAVGVPDAAPEPVQQPSAGERPAEVPDDLPF